MRKCKYCGKEVGLGLVATIEHDYLCEKMPSKIDLFPREPIHMHFITGPDAAKKFNEALVEEAKKHIGR